MAPMEVLGGKGEVVDVSDRSKSDPTNSESRLRANESVGRSGGSDTGIAEVVEAMMVVTV